MLSRTLSNWHRSFV